MAVYPTSVDVQIEFNGVGAGWTSVIDDVRAAPAPSLSYGIMGNGPLDRVASTGTLTFALDNSAGNSGSKLGYYSPGHANARSGFELGIRARVVIVYSGTTYYKFIGTLIEIDPQAGQYGDRATLCTVVDWMDEAAQQKLNGLAVQVGKRADELIASVVGNLTRQPVATSYTAAQLACPYAFDTVEDESTTALSELAKIADSDLGFVYLRGDTSTGGVLTFHDRRVRQNPGAAVATLSETMSGLQVIRKRGNIYNRLRAVIHPRVVDSAATTVLFTLDQSNPPALAASESLTIFAPYSNPTLREARVGGTDMVTPVASTDYKFGIGPGDGSLTANLGVSVSYGGNGAIYTLTNNGTVSGFVTLLQARGRGLYDYNALTLSATDSTSKTTYGENVLTYDLAYEPRPTVGQSIITYFLAYYKSPYGSVDGVSFFANNSSALMTAALACEPGSLITLTETVTGIATGQYFVHSVTLTLIGPNILECQWLLAPRFDTTDYWILDTSLLGTTTIPGY